MALVAPIISLIIYDFQKIHNFIEKALLIGMRRYNSVSNPDLDIRGLGCPKKIFLALRPPFGLKNKIVCVCVCVGGGGGHQGSTTGSVTVI